MNKKFLSVISLAFVFTYISCGLSVCAKTASSQAAQSQPGGAPAVTAQTAIVADADTGLIYYQKDMHTQMYPASITKIMTGLLAVENGSDSDVITAPTDIQKGMPRDAARIYLSPGEQITQEQALYTTFLASANDSANLLALHTGGTMERFVTMMNDRAKELGAVETHFANANGLPDANNVTSAYDMAIITKKALQNPTLMKYFGATTYTMPANNFRKEPVPYRTLHKMMRNTKYQYDGVIAGKTGWETMSGHTLVTAAKKDGRTLICVVMKSSDGYTVYKDTIALLNYGFAQPAGGTSADYLKEPVPEPSATPSVSPQISTVPKVQPPAQVKVNTAPFIVSSIVVCLLAFLTGCFRFSKRARLVVRRLPVAAEPEKQNYEAFKR